MIEALTESGIFYQGVGIGLLFGIPLSVLFASLMLGENKWVFIICILVGGGCAVGFVGSIVHSLELFDQRDVLIQERDEIRKNMVMGMSCEVLRLNTLSIMETEHEKYIENTLEWQQEYYNLKCETPLREEVMRLQ